MARGASTRERLVEAALRTVTEEGIAETSSRSIARRAGVTQALIFYHFPTIDDLLAEASREVARARATVYAERLAEADSFTALVATARRLHEEERAAGRLTLLTQLIAGGRSHPRVLVALRENFDLLADEVASTVARLLAGTPLDGLLAPERFARTIAAGYLGIELIDTIAPGQDPGLFEELDVLATLVDAVLETGVVERRLLRRRLRRRRGSASGPHQSRDRSP